MTEKTDHYSGDTLEEAINQRAATLVARRKVQERGRARALPEPYGPDDDQNSFFRDLLACADHAARVRASRDDPVSRGRVPTTGFGHNPSVTRPSVDDALARLRRSSASYDINTTTVAGSVPIGLLVRAPWHATSPTEAVLFRKIAKDKPTLLFDEIDAVFGSNSERTEPIRAILNAGNRPGATIPRCVGQAAEVKDFAIFCPKVLAGIDTGRLPDTIRDRAVVIKMMRRHAGEPVQRLRIRKAEEQATDLLLWLEDWAGRVGGLLEERDPDLPDERSGALMTDGSRTEHRDLADAPVLQRPHVDAQPQETSRLPSVVTNPDAADAD
jgi:hypothetical protein